MGYPGFQFDYDHLDSDEVRRKGRASSYFRWDGSESTHTITGSYLTYNNFYGNFK